MDSKIVNREIRTHVWPLLADAGFRSTTSRTAWRHHDDRVDVVNFQSFNARTADALGVTTFSFAVNLGCFLTYVPPQCPLRRVEGGRPFPQEHECQLRGSIAPSARLAARNPGVWSVDRSGRNLAACMEDVVRRVPEALAWFARFDDRREVLRILLHDEESMSTVWGFGASPSPVRAYLVGHVALALGETELARRELGNAVLSGCFSG